MKYFALQYGSFHGIKTGHLYHTNKGEEFDAPEGDVHEDFGRAVKIEPVKVEKAVRKPRENASKK